MICEGSKCICVWSFCVFVRRWSLALRIIKICDIIEKMDHKGGNLRVYKLQ